MSAETIWHTGKYRIASSLKKQEISADAAQPVEWKGYQRFLFRIAFIFFILLSLPNSLYWYKAVLTLNWFRLNYRDIYDIARFGSGVNWFGNSIFGSSLLGYAEWIITLIVATVGALIWTAIVRLRKTERKEYNRLYYWLRVVVRYRAGIGIIGFGFTKVFPVQLPYPSLGILNTNFGDLTAQKIYWLSIGIAPWYEVFAGIVEVAAGAMLFFRRTTTLGAILLLGALGDIVYVNLAYNGGVHVYSSYFVLLAAFLLIKDIPKIYNLLIREKVTVPVNLYPSFSGKWLRYVRIALKSATIFIFLILLFYLQCVNFIYDPYKQPSVAGVHELRGNYLVSEFRINNQVIPYSPLDTVRWQEATFEKWSTLTFRVNRPVPLDLSNGGGAPQRDIGRTFEMTGVAGGQRVFHYQADTIDKVLYLEDKYRPVSFRMNRGGAGRGRSGSDSTAAFSRNRSRRAANAGSGNNWISEEARAHIGNELTMINSMAASDRRDKEFAAAPRNERRNRMILKYNTTDGSTVVLTGIDERKDSLYIVLKRIDRPYALSESKLQAGTY